MPTVSGSSQAQYDYYAQLHQQDPQQARQYAQQAQTQNSAAATSSLPAGWTAHTSAEGSIYYFHQASNKTQWERPHEGDSTQVQSLPPAAYLQRQPPAWLKGASDPKKPYKEIGMLKSGYDKDLNNAMMGVPITYLNAAERQQHEVLVGDDGLLYKQRPQGATLMDTRGAVNPKDAELYAMTSRGNVYAASSRQVKHHSSFLAGNPGSSFGSVSVNDGYIRKVSDASGHYYPPIEYSAQLPKELHSRGADLSQMETEYLGRSKNDIKKSGRTFDRMYSDGIRKKKY